jgi:hypothetical protein
VLLLTNIYDDDSVDIIEGGKFQAFDPMPEKCIYNDDSLKYLAYTPDNDFTRKLIEKSNKKFNFSVKNFEDEKILDVWMESKELDGPAVGIIFGDLSNFTKLNYKIRFSSSNHDSWFTNQMHSERKYSRIFNGKYPENPPYYDSCFLAIQNSIDRAFINDEKILPVELKAFPYPDIRRSFIMEFREPFSFIFVCSIILSVYKIISVSKRINLKLNSNF